ncbi:transposase domain-containing protein [Loktanella sp. PT4BL]
MASLIETCKINGIEVHDYLSRVLLAVAEGHKPIKIEQLLPWNCAKTV